MNRLLLLFLVFFGATELLGQTALSGKVIDEENQESIPFCNIALYKNGVLQRGEATDLDGNFAFYNLDPGTYDVEVSYTGYSTQRIEEVIVYGGKTNILNVSMSAGVVLDEVVVVEYKVPLVEQDNTTSGATVTGDQIRNLPTKNIAQVAATSAGISSIAGEAPAIRGSRTNATNYYVDGIRVSAQSLIPTLEVDQLQVITGGVEARYGDVTGGVISITSKGPANRFTIASEFETSKYLDPFEWSEVNLSISGPILRNKRGESVIGYRLGSRYQYRLDDGPSILPHYRATQTTLDALESEPITQVGSGRFGSVEFLHDSDVQELDYRPNEDLTNINLSGKIDARLSPSIDLSFSGGYQNREDMFTPGGGAFGTNAGVWNVYNYHNNAISNDERYRGSLRYRHLIGNQNDENKGLFRNASLILQGGYEYRSGSSMDSRHGNDLFRYGHVGTFDFDWIPTEGESEYSGAINGLAHAGFLQVLNEPFTPSIYNPVLANYNNLVDQTSFNNYNAFNGFVSNSFNSAFGIYSNVGNVYNVNSQFELETRTINASLAFDLVPGGSDKGRHSIEIGFMYEDRINRSYSINPFRLWEVARLQANRQINGVDTSQVVGSFNGTVTGVLYDQFQTLVVETPGQSFYKSVRDLTGQTVNDYVNVDGIDPDDLSLDMFSILELRDQQLLGYFGYDYLGNPISNDVTFNDFFTARDANGERSFPIAPNRPEYQAFYIQDKFQFKDIIFRLGLRVDRFDANTQVLKDPYSLYEIMSANDFYASFGGDRPGTVGDDFKVYVEDEGSSTVRAYRDGDQWYFANGTPANDGRQIFGGEIVTPQYYEDRVNNIKSDDFDPSNSFEPYKAQVNWMPRIAVSFPISDKANFFAHYDVLVQRPPSNTIATAFDWYYFEDINFTASNPFNNPNLRPERTVDYEVGFQQRLSNSSAIKIQAYYKELRDMIQQRTYLNIPSPITSYVTYDNLDFATVKGFSFQYDLRRNRNLTAQLNYTLQFADGTGSDVNSQAGLTENGNIRNLFPLNRDERHSFKINVDYRYGSGTSYNGPRIGDIPILANTGLNLQSFIVSGRPYTRRIRPTEFGGSGFFGSINGARRPWTFTLDVRLDKSFTVNQTGNRPLRFNIFLRSTNVLNISNVRNVYSASGSPDDSGFINSRDGQASLENIRNTGDAVVAAGRDEQAYLDTFGWRVANGFNYYLPRQLFAGLRFDL